MQSRELRGRTISAAAPSPFLNAHHSPLRGFEALVHTALESSAIALSIAVSTSASKSRSGEWSACTSELESAALRCGPP